MDVSEQSQPSVETSGGGERTGELRVPTTLRSWVVGLLAANVVLDIAAAACAGAVLWMVDQIRNGVQVEEGVADLADLIVGLTALGELALLVGTAVVFSVWFYRINVIARQIASEPAPMSSGFAVGSFYIPIVCLYSPFRAALFCWRASAPLAYPDRARPPSGWLVGVWWVSWLVMNIGVTVLLRATEIRANNTNPTLEEVEREQHGILAASGIEIIAAVLAGTMVVAMTRMQCRVSENVRAAAAG